MTSSVPSNPTANHVAALLPKFNDADSDLRYMSLSDLYNILRVGSHSFLLNDYNTCARTVDGVLKTLDDQNGEVQNQAIKWYDESSTCELTWAKLGYSLGPLAAKIPNEMVPPLIEKLSTLKPTNSIDSSVPATAMRTLIISFPAPVPGLPPSKPTQEAYSAISKVLIPRLVGYIVIPHGVKTQAKPPPGMLRIDTTKGPDSDAIDILIELVRCFGPMLQNAEKQALQKSVMAILEDERTSPVVKKKIVVAVSLLAMYLTDSQLSGFVSTTIESFRSNLLSPSKRRLLITMLGSLARSVPQRIGPYLKTLAPFVLGALSEQERQDSLEELAQSGGLDPTAEEIKEAALVTLEAFLSSCSQEMRLYTDESIEAAIRYVDYDPIMTMNHDDEDMSGSQDSNNDDDHDLSDVDAEDEDFEEEGGMSDDEDNSWKIRRCSVKALYTIISTRGSGDLLENGTLYDKVAPILISCFKEREENVRLEILATMAALVRKTGERGSIAKNAVDDEGYVSATQSSRSRKRRRGSSDDFMADVQRSLSSSRSIASPALSPSAATGPRAELAGLSSAIVRGVAKLLRHKSLPTRQAATALLRDFVLVQRGGVSEFLGLVVDPLIEAIQRPGTVSNGLNSTSAGGAASAADSSLRIEALLLLGAMCDSHSPELLSLYLERLIPSVVFAVQDKYFKVSSEAIRVAESLVGVITPAQVSQAENKHKVYLMDLFNVVADRAKANDADLEVRQQAIHALAVILARTSGLSYSKSLSGSQRATVQDVLLDRLRNETTRLATVRAIHIVLNSPFNKEALTTNWLRTVSLDLAGQLRKSDRTLRSSSLGALKSLVSNPVALESLDSGTTKDLVEMLLPLVNSNDLHLLGSTTVVLSKLVEHNPKIVVNNNLVNALCKIVLAPLGGNVLEAFLGLVDTIGAEGVGQQLMQAFLKNVGVTGDPAVVGVAIGTLLVSGKSTVGVKVDDFVTELKSAQDDQRKCLALSILGEVGLRLGSSSPLQPDVFLIHFKSNSAQLPRAAAVALGHAGAGNVAMYMPVILSNMSKPGSTQNLLLHSIREILKFTARTGTNISDYTGEIWKKLLATSQSEDNRAVGAECIGRLTSIDPKTYLPQLQVDSAQLRSL